MPAHLQELLVRNAVGTAWLWGMLSGALTMLMAISALTYWPRWIPVLAAIANVFLLFRTWDRVEQQAVDSLKLEEE
jgi:hypothetical protein